MSFQIPVTRERTCAAFSSPYQARLVRQEVREDHVARQNCPI